MSDQQKLEMLRLRIQRSRATPAAAVGGRPPAADVAGEVLTASRPGLVTDRVFDVLGGVTQVEASRRQPLSDITSGPSSARRALVGSAGGGGGSGSPPSALHSAQRTSTYDPLRLHVAAPRAGPRSPGAAAAAERGAEGAARGPSDLRTPRFQPEPRPRRDFTADLLGAGSVLRSRSSGAFSAVSPPVRRSDLQVTGGAGTGPCDLYESCAQRLSPMLKRLAQERFHDENAPANVPLAEISQALGSTAAAGAMELPLTRRSDASSGAVATPPSKAGSPPSSGRASPPGSTRAAAAAGACKVGSPPGSGPRAAAAAAAGPQHRAVVRWPAERLAVDTKGSVLERALPSTPKEGSPGLAPSPSSSSASGSHGRNHSSVAEASTPTGSRVGAKGKGKGKLPPPPPRTPSRPFLTGKGGGKTWHAGLQGDLPGASRTPRSLSRTRRFHKADVTPKVPMKRLFWQSFAVDDEPPQAQGASVWSVIEDLRSIDAQFDVDELERLFREFPTGKFGRTLPRGHRRRAWVFEEARRRQVCVLLARLPPVLVTIQAVRDMDETKLDKDQVELLLSTVPSPAELAALSQMASDLEKQGGEPLAWEDAEDFVIRLSEVPCFTIRLQLWSFENSLQEHLAMFDNAAREVVHACEVLRQSPRIRRILAMTLSIGNYLNAGTLRGCADGFTVDSLQQLRTLKTPAPAQGVATLLDFLVQQLERSRPGDLELAFSEGGEALAVRAAAKHKLGDLLKELEACRRHADNLPRQAAAAEGDHALQHRGRRVELRIAQELVPLQGRLREAQESYNDLCAWFHDGRLRQARDPHEFFAVWDDFLQAVQASLKTLRRGVVRRRRATIADMRRPVLSPR